tara:strand:- start:351 stop:1091 length:741 start_codon:yes stop_codon:yes gene_type:complete
METLGAQLKKLGLDNPNKFYGDRIDHTPFYKSLDKAQMNAVRSTFRETLLWTQRVCQLTGWCHKPSLVASHIKPLRHCKDEEEATTSLNGLLLNKHIDGLFDKGYISFDEGRRLMISVEIGQKKVLGQNWGEQLKIGIGEFILAAWQAGDDRCKIPAISIVPKVTWNTPFRAGININSSINQIRKMGLPKWQVDKAFFEFNKLRELHKQSVLDAQLRASFLDYHRRHIFRSPEIQHADNDRTVVAG